MSTDHTPNPAMLATKLASLAAVLAVVVGVMVLAGWAFDIAVLKSILPGWVAMKANASVCFILTGIALLLTTRLPAILNPQRAVFFSRLARYCSLLVGLIGLLTLGEYIFGWNPGLDQWLTRAPAGTVGTSYPGRMAPDTALNFVLLSAALWITGSSRQTRSIIPARWMVLVPLSLGLLVTTLALVALLSYAAPTLNGYGWFGFNIIALHTAMLFVMLGVVVAAISWRPDVLQWSLGRNATVALACGMAVLVFIGLSTNRSQFWMKEANYRIAYNEQVLNNIASLRFDVVDAQAHVRGYVITGNEQLKTDYLEAKTNSNVKLNALRKLMAGSPHQQQQFAQIEMLVNEDLQWLQQAVDIERASITDAARSKRVAHGEDLLDNLRVTFDQIESEHRQLAERLKQESESMERLSNNIIFTGTLASLMIFLSVIFRLNFAVSESKQAWQALKKSAALLNEMGRMAKVGGWEFNVETRDMMWTEEVYRIHELDMTYKPTVDKGIEFYAPASRPIIVRVVQRAIEYGEPYDVELEFITAKGNHRWVHANGKAHREHGKTLTVYGTFQDITERKQAEEKLRETRDYLENLFNHANAPIIVWDASYRITMFNHAFEHLSGRDASEVIGKQIDILFPADHKDEALSHINKTQAGERWETVEIPILHSSGEARTVLWNSATIYSADGKNVVATMAQGQDITERKAAEIALQQTQVKLQEALRIAKLGSWQMDSATNHVFWTEELYRMFGLNPELPPPDYTEQQRLFTPESWERLSAALLRTQETGVPYELELEIVRADGSHRWMLARGEAVHNASGAIAGLQGVAQDITERKQASSQLAEQLDELRRWQKVMLGREMRTIEVMREVNELLAQAGQPPRYPSAEENAK